MNLPSLLVENPTDLASASLLVIRLRDAVRTMHDALTKISAIRDSIVGQQGFNFSEHAYPLVAALKAAGYEGAGYEISRKNLGTLIEQIKTCEAEPCLSVCHPRST
jgi:hypothetical protein